MNQKGFANIVLVLVIVVLVGAIGYFALTRKQESVSQQTTTPPPITTQPSTPQVVTPAPADETTNWKIYHSEKYGFEFKYPELVRVGNVYGDGRFVEGLSPQGSLGVYFPGDFTGINIVIDDFPFSKPNLNCMKLNTAFARARCIYPRDPAADVFVSDANLMAMHPRMEMISGVEVLRTDTSIKVAFPSQAFFSMIWVGDDYWRGHKQPVKYSVTVNQIISTLKFTK